jgi:hypothetical protein
MRATLTSGRAPLAGQLINFSTRHPQAAPLCTAVTDSNGVASCDATVNQIARIAAANGYDATFAGSADHLPSRGTGAIIGS